MQPTARIRLLDADPDIGQALTPEDRAAMRQLTLPVLELDRGSQEIADDLRSARALGALVLDGMLSQRLGLAGHTAMRLLGPGDYLLTSLLDSPAGSARSEWTAGTEVRLALFGAEMLAALRHWPGLVLGWHERLGIQSARVATQLVICQLPRVSDRVLGVMWLLADIWGRVTPTGVLLPLALTHEALGELVGARRPTVTLALRELVRRGAILRQDRGWLLVESLPDSEPADDHERTGADLIDDAASLWGETTPALLACAEASELRAEHLELLATARRMRLEFEADRERVAEQLSVARHSRERMADRRQRRSPSA
jgi:CRP/FNR family cyclic AMP-dependent transcriptional regulator